MSDFKQFCFQGGAAANPLEEIMEQEETNVPLTAAAAGDTQEEESSFSKSTDVSPPSPSPDADLPSTVAMESHGEDQSEDLPSGDKYEPQVVRDAAIHFCICSTFNPPSLIFTGTCRTQRMSLHLQVKSGLRTQVRLRQQMPVSPLKHSHPSMGDRSHCSGL